MKSNNFSVKKSQIPKIDEVKNLENILFPIVGIGASAGGLEAFTELLKALPIDTGMAFVLVQHLDPQHESALTTLLAKATSMPVHEVTEGVQAEINILPY